MKKTLITVLVISLLAIASYGEPCQHQSLDLGFVTDAAWFGNELFTIEFVPDRGHSVLALSEAGVRTLEGKSNMVLIQETDGGGLLFESLGGGFSEISRDEPLSDAKPNNIAPGEEFFPYTWGTTPDMRTLVFCGEVKRETKPRGWQKGLFLYEPDTAGKRVQTLVEHDLHAESRTLLVGCRLNGNMLSSLSGKMYALMYFQGGAQILEITPDSTDEYEARVLGLGRSDVLEVKPPLPHFVMRSEYDALMTQVESSTMSVELVSQGDFLYLLMREPLKENTQWSLARIDPSSDPARVEVAELPFQANHLRVFPGEGRWSFIEQGPFRGLADQDTTGIWFVPNARLQSAFSGDSKLCGD